MKIAFYFDGPQWNALAEMAAVSAKRVMPDVPTIQLCMPGMARVRGMDDVHEIVAPAPVLTRRRWAAHAQLDGDILFADVDCLFHADVRHVFDRAFEIAVPRIADARWRYTGGVSFSRSPAFWRRLSGGTICARSVEPSLDEILAAFNTAVDMLGAAAIELPHHVYERLPQGAHDDCAGAAIVHYRGPRKKWMRLP